MSDRTIRRAAERKARKIAAKQHKQQQPQQPEVAQREATQPKVMTATAGAAASEPDTLQPGVIETNEETATNEPTHKPLSEAQLNANRANAQKSTGPATIEGRAKSSLNAIKTGLTGQTVLLPSDDATAYQAHLDRHFTRHAPATDEEHTLVQMLADAEWRLLRIPGLEASLYALGHRKLADLHPDEPDPAVRRSLITAEILLAYRRDLNNLGLQERRLRNQHKADLEKLKALQDERIEKKQEKAKIQARMNEAIRCMHTSLKVWGTFLPVEFGFEFSFDEIRYCDEITRSSQRLGYQAACYADLLASYRNGDQEEKPAA